MNYLLPGGYIDAQGCVHREVVLSPLNGLDEELLCSKSNRNVPAVINELLSRRIMRIGDIFPITPQIAKNLLVADRLYIMLMLRKVTFGDKIQGYVSCPWPGCGEKMDFDFLIGDVPIKEQQERTQYYTLRILAGQGNAAENTSGDVIVFRLPNGGDQETLCDIVSANEGEALSLLLCRCIKSIGTIENPDIECIRTLPSQTRQAVEEKMRELAPAVDLTIESKCPECCREFSLPLEIQDFFFGELSTSRDLLYREVHYLAYHYHWSEREIMEMTRDKRRAYIEILAEEIERMNCAAQS